MTSEPVPPSLAPSQPPLSTSAPVASGGPAGRSLTAKVGWWVLVHCGGLVVAVGLLAAYEHLRVGGHTAAALGCLAGAAVLAFAPIRHLVGALFGVERRVMHVVHGVGGLALVGLPLTGVVGGAPVLTHAAMAPFAVMGAAQALMHSNSPRNAQQAAALRSFVQSLPQVAALASGRNLSSPEGARRAMAALTGIVAKAQALGETELASDPGFQGALRKVLTRFGAGMGMDAVQLAISKLAGSAGNTADVAALRRQLAQARRTFAGQATTAQR